MKNNKTIQDYLSEKRERFAYLQNDDNYALLKISQKKKKYLMSGMSPTQKVYLYMNDENDSAYNIFSEKVSKEFANTLMNAWKYNVP